jgi:hypothetical protein
MEKRRQREVLGVVGSGAARIRGMSSPSTKTVDVKFDRDLLERLRERRPEQSDREVLEGVARIQLGLEASDRARASFAGVPPDEIEREAVKAAKEVRRERAVRRAKA